MKPLLYTHNKDADVAQYAVRNPIYFRGVEAEFDSVVIDGEWTEIADAYEKAGKKVEVLKKEEPKVAAAVKAGTKQSDKG